MYLSGHGLRNSGAVCASVDWCEACLVYDSVFDYVGV